MFDKVHTALQHALDGAGIDCPFPTQTLNLLIESEVAEQISQSFQGHKRKPGVN
jgi:hypothetical protein